MRVTVSVSLKNVKGSVRKVNLISQIRKFFEDNTDDFEDFVFEDIEDDIGGHHDGGVGTDPNGQFCGECSRISCEHFKVWRKNVEQSNNSKNIS